MNRFLMLFVSVCLFVPGQSSANAEDLMTSTIASQIGLEQAWMRQLSVPAGAQSIVNQQIFVHMEDQHEYVEIVRDGAPDPKVSASPNAKSGEVLVRIPTDRVGRSGAEIGKAEAERLARNEIRRLTHRGVKAKITSRTVPKVRLYTMSDDGTVDCRNAETGEPVWLARVGDRRLGYGNLGVDGEYVSVVNGANLIKLDAKTGIEISAQRTVNAPVFGAVIAGRFTLLPTVQNGVDGYPNYQTDDPPFSEQVAGLALSPPAKSPTSTKVAWATDRGFVFVMELSGKPSVMFRLDTDGIVSGGIASARGDKFYFGSEIGQVYGVKATRSGKVLWSRPYGEPFYDKPVLLDDKIFIRSAYGNMFSINTENGIMNWAYPVPSVAEVLGAFDGKIFVRLMGGGFSVVDVESGKTVGNFFGFKPGLTLANPASNRLYMVSSNGAVQCLRPVDSLIPEFNKVVMSTPMTKEEMMSKEVMEKGETAVPTPPFGGQETKNPFGTDAAVADPFGAAGAADPFGGGGDDPFGGGGAGKGDDPFADPFN